MRFYYLNILLIGFLTFDCVQISIAQSSYKWINIPDTVNRKMDLAPMAHKRLRNMLANKVELPIAEIEQDIRLAKDSGDILKLAYGFYQLAAIADFRGDYEQAIRQYKTSIFWTEQTHYTLFVASLYSQAGYAMSRISHYDSALVYYEKALALRTQLNDTLAIVNTKNFIGLVYQRTGKYEQAFQQYTDALKLISDLAPIEAKAFTYNNIGSIFIKTGNFKLAEKYLLSALKIRKKSNNESLIAHSYIKFARLYYEKGEINSSIEYGLNAVSIFDKKNWEKPLSSIYNLLGLCYLSKKEYKEAKDFFLSAKKTGAKENNQFELVQNAINFGKLFVATHKYKTAIKYLNWAIEHGNELALKTEVINAYAKLADVYFYDHQYKRAFLAKKEEEKLKKEVFNSGFAEKIAGFISSKEVEKANLIFELQQKEWEIKNNTRLHKEKLFRKLYFVSISIFSIFIFILFRSIRSKIKSNKKLQKSNKLIAQKQDEILSQKNTLEHQKQELTASLYKLRKLTKAINQSSSTVVITDTKGNIEYVNPKFTQTTGYTFEEAIGKNPRILKSGDKPKSFYREMWEILLSGNEWHGEFENIRKNGEVYFESASIASVINDEGKITNFIAVKEDITEQKKILAKLEGLNAIQTKIFSVIGHDLRSPLGTVKAMLEIISQKDYVLENKELSKIIDAILKSVVSVNLLTENLLNWAKSWQGSGNKEPDYFKISEKVNENIELLTAIANQKSIKLYSNVDQTYTIYADPNMISTVIRNLIANAIKFTKRNGSVKISAQKFDGEIKISIKDSGIGIKKDLIPILLDEYDLFTTPGTDQEKGSGLGLSICLQFIKINGGKMLIESIEGEGSTFSFTLPTEKP